MSAKERLVPIFLKNQEPNELKERRGQSIQLALAIKP